MQSEVKVLFNIQLETEPDDKALTVPPPPFALTVISPLTSGAESGVHLPLVTGQLCL